MNLRVALFPLSTLPVPSSETFNVTTCSPREASAATFPLILTVASCPSVAPVFLTTGPFCRLTPLGNPEPTVKLTFPFSPLSETLSGTLKVAPLKIVTSGMLV